ncbi:NAD(P)H-binding protein [uncultured Jatrophihabitans sp.]|uniref:NAD(P)H-binding protein n=1 Tax=uncultured Jatrophihabitans sp. TaxID=1610747 RepID=UPI0035CAD0B4
MRTLVTGATGFVGRHLVPELLAAGHEVDALTRHPDRYTGPGKPVGADVGEPATLPAALTGHDVAFYLVHSLDHGDFRHRDAAAARAFGAAAQLAGVSHIVYLSGLGDPADNLSAHLRSRQEVEGLLADGGVRVTSLRAAMVIGDRSTSWEIIRGMVEHLPALAAPTWAHTRSQPIALDDVLRYLLGVLELPDTGSRAYDIGGSEVLQYTQVLSRLSALEGRPALQVTVPTPGVRLSALAASRLLPFITGVDARTVRSLVESMRNEVVVRDDAIRRLVPFEPMDYDQAMLAALGARAKRRRAKGSGGS